MKRFCYVLVVLFCLNRSALADFQSFKDAIQAAYDDFDVQKYDDAEQNFNLALTMTSSSEDKASAYVGLGQVYQSKKSYAASLQAYDSALAFKNVSSPRRMLAFTGKADVLATTKKFDSARVELLKALGLPDVILPLKINLQKSIGATYSSEGKFDLARKEYQKVLIFKTEVPDVESSIQILVGQTYTSERKYVQARKEFSKVQELSPDKEVSKLPADLASFFKRLIEVNKQRAYLNIAYSYFAEKNYVQAKVKYSEILLLDKLDLNTKLQAQQQLKVISALEAAQKNQKETTR